MTPEAFFAAERCKPMVWGSTDCASTVDRWIRHVRGASAMEAGATTFADGEEAGDMLRRIGLARLFARSMRAIGLEQTDDPQPGDVAVLRFGPMAVCAVRGERMWLFRSATGLGAAPLDARVICAWSLT